MPDTLTHVTEHKSFSEPAEVREFPHGRAEILSFAGGEVGRLVFEPGWRWSNDGKPIGGTQGCLGPPVQYHVSGRPGIRMDDGTEFVAGPGDVTSLPQGHDAWVVGDEPAVVVDWYGATNYAVPAAPKGQGTTTHAGSHAGALEAFTGRIRRLLADSS